MRNDHLSNPLSPYDSNHSTAGFCELPNLVWVDSLEVGKPATLIAGRVYTDRENVFNWPLNYVAVHIAYPDASDVEKKEGKKFGASVPGHEFVVVTLGGFTPWFDSYLVRMDGGEWRKSPARFFWELKDRANRMEVKSVNKLGADGIVNIVEVERGERKSYFDFGF